MLFSEKVLNPDEPPPNKLLPVVVPAAPHDVVVEDVLNLKPGAGLAGPPPRVESGTEAPKAVLMLLGADAPSWKPPDGAEEEEDCPNVKVLEPGCIPDVPPPVLPKPPNIGGGAAVVLLATPVAEEPKGKTLAVAGAATEGDRVPVVATADVCAAEFPPKVRTVAWSAPVLGLLSPNMKLVDDPPGVLVVVAGAPALSTGGLLFVAPPFVVTLLLLPNFKVAAVEGTL